jgi:hypothetical protein
VVFRRPAADQSGRLQVGIPQYELESRETASLVEAYYRIPPEERRAVHRLIKATIAD